MTAELICWLEAQGTEHNRAEKFSDRGNGGHVIEHGQLERGEADRPKIPLLQAVAGDDFHVDFPNLMAKLTVSRREKPKTGLGGLHVACRVGYGLTWRRLTFPADRNIRRARAGEYKVVLRPSHRIDRL